MHVFNVLKTHSNVSTVSSPSKANANIVHCRWWFKPTNMHNGLSYILVLCVVSKVTASQKSMYWACWLAWDQNMLKIFPSLSNWKSEKNCGLSFLHNEKKIIASTHHLHFFPFAMLSSCQNIMIMRYIFLTYVDCFGNI
jgi:hypothetical protein